MKSFRLAAFAAAVLLLASCTSNKAGISASIPSAPNSALVIKQLNGTAVSVLDTVKTDAAGAFRYNVKLQPGQPEFIYIYKGDTRLASLLAQAGETLAVEADTLGNYTVEGSDASALLKRGDDAYKAFLSRIVALSNSGAEPAEIAKEYVSHYRESAKFVLENSGSLAVIPVLYEGMPDAPTFSSLTDAFIFRRVCDSLSTLYPDSKYVKALEKETQRREHLFNLSNSLNSASESPYPELNLPGLDGQKVSLTGLDAKLVLVYFWSASDATHKIFNQDVLKPLYAQYASRGFDIYAVGVGADKVEWAQVVKDQQLPWKNVNDGLGTASRALYLYNVQSVPACVLVSEKEVRQVEVSEKALRAALASML
ncbi:MAG: TlpA family protein disulfide reductase [Bacteroidales bacterium]|nr:TlpA family protein disulfide reductase [Bacteroidales bacterium]